MSETYFTVYATRRGCPEHRVSVSTDRRDARRELQHQIANLGNKARIEVKSSLSKRNDVKSISRNQQIRQVLARSLQKAMAE